MKLFDHLQKDYIQARKNRDKFSSGVLSLFLSDLKYIKINEQKELDDQTVLSFLSKTVKQKKATMAEFEKAGRNDLLEKEQKELDFLSQYLPKALSESELKELILQSVDEVGAASPSDMGKVMKVVMPKVSGRAEGADVKRILTEILKG